jgi:endonuclease/exonuclease/phosphatase family metal-dependent hydrolase
MRLRVSVGCRIAVTMVALGAVTVLPGAVTAAPADGLVPGTTRISNGPHVSDRSAGGHDRPPADDFVVASFNVLGHSHTTPGGGPHHHHGYMGSSIRMAMAALVLHQTDVDVVGFQELQHVQYEQMLSETRALGERWGTFSGSARDTDNTIAWRRNRFKLVRGWRVSIPYFHGHARPMPVVELRSRTSGRDVYFMNVHNPADTRGPAAHWRQIAVARERQVTTDLTRQEQTPVFLTGDMNDRAAFFCPFTANQVMRSFIGGSHTGGRCRPPKSGIDWILGNSFVTFRSHRIDKSVLVSAATDHPVVSAHVRIAGPTEGP